MNESRNRLKQAMTAFEDPPPFDRVFAAADRRYRRRRTGRMAAGIAAALVVVAVFFTVTGEPEPVYIEFAELLETTQWRAPSDALMPDYASELYDKLPPEPLSTDPAEGALL